MAKRRKMNRGKSERLFSSTANKIHPKNQIGGASSVGPMRGGIRL